MKGTDIRTVDALITEYGMSQGSSTPTSQQQSGASAKISAASKPQKSPTAAPSQSPTTQQNKMYTSAPAEPEAPVVNKARELENKKTSARIKVKNSKLINSFYPKSCNF